MSKAQQHSTPTINEVKSLFQAWRQTRKKRERIPEALWHQVLKLIDRYSTSMITAQLGINSKQLKEAQIRHNQNSVPPNDHSVSHPLPMTFVETQLPASISLSETASDLCIMEIQRNDGAKLKVDRIPVASLSKIINQFVN